MKARKRDVWPWVEAAFPEYAGRSFRVRATERVSFFDLNWGGGSRNQYVAVDLATRRVAHPEGANSPPWRNPVEGKTVDLPPGVVIVEHSFFQGKDVGITVHVNPANVVAGHSKGSVVLFEGLAGAHGAGGMAGAALSAFADLPRVGSWVRWSDATGDYEGEVVRADPGGPPGGTLLVRLGKPSDFVRATRRVRADGVEVVGSLADARCPAGTVLHKPARGRRRAR